MTGGTPVRIWDRRGKTWFVPKGAVERARNSGTLPYRSILIELKS